MHAIEWNDSCDGNDMETELIMACISRSEIVESVENNAKVMIEKLQSMIDAVKDSGMDDGYSICVYETNKEAMEAAKGRDHESRVVKFTRDTKKQLDRKLQIAMTGLRGALRISTDPNVRERIRAAMNEVKK